MLPGIGHGSISLLRGHMNSAIARRSDFSTAIVGYGAVGRGIQQLDPRIGRRHTFVLPHDRGFGARCLPKDLSAIIDTARSSGVQPMLLKATREVNTKMRRSVASASRGPATSE